MKGFFTKQRLKRYGWSFLSMALSLWFLRDSVEIVSALPDSVCAGLFFACYGIGSFWGLIDPDHYAPGSPLDCLQRLFLNNCKSPEESGDK